jgi:hypothetical protein
LINYPTYDKELYALVQSVKKWKHYFLGKETIIHTNHPWEIISMDFVGGLPMYKRNHDYIYVVVDCFSKMCIFMPCKKQVTAKKMAQMFFEHVWVHFGFPKCIISDRDS